MVERSPGGASQAVVGIHSLDHFVFDVPDLNEAARFYSDFGLEVKLADLVRDSTLAGAMLRPFSFVLGLLPPEFQMIRYLKGW